MSANLDHYLVLSEEGFKAFRDQAYSTRKEAEEAAMEWHKHDGKKMIIFHKLIIIEAPNVKVRGGE